MPILKLPIAEHPTLASRVFTDHLALAHQGAPCELLGRRRRSFKVISRRGGTGSGHACRPRHRVACETRDGSRAGGRRRQECGGMAQTGTAETATEEISESAGRRGEGEAGDWDGNV